MKNIQQNDKNLKILEEIRAFQEKIIDDLKLLEVRQETLKDIEAIKNREIEIIEEIDLLIADKR